ncbi:hypothetical protein ACN28G_27060 [Micromonospora sp. WMMA1923]|uniref:hypothetical protein n=1 Tax=Micromonospora sp. WMMA1923 TaxID=3404125 RepID=UPI003B93DB71
MVGALLHLAHRAIRDLPQLPAVEVVRRFVFVTRLTDDEARRIALYLMRSRYPVADEPGTAHTPMRPLWRCSQCRQEWPCEPAREALLRRFAGERDALLIQLGALLAHAGDQLRQIGAHPTPVELDRRFLSWARSLPPGS